MKPRVIDVQCLNDYRVLLTFANNERRILDVSPFLSLGIFQKLKDTDEFKQVQVGFGTIEWPCGADLDPEYVWDKSVPVGKEADHHPLTQA